MKKFTFVRIVFGALLVCAVSGVTGCATSRAPSAPLPIRPRLILISLDGLRPEFYLDPAKYAAPTLQRLAREGARAQGVETIYPSVTYAAHTSMVTGVPPAVHGVWGNTVFSPETGSSPAWYWEASYLKKPTLWGEAQREGRRVAILTWPVTVGAKVTALVPEVFPRSFPSSESTWDLVQKTMDPELLRRLSEQTTEPKLDGFDLHDRWITDAAVYYARGLSPEPIDLMMVHLIDVDHQAHDWGKDASQTLAALKTADEQIRRIWEANEQGLHATIVVTGDHGFYDYDRQIRINSLFAEKGWLKSATDWSVTAHLAGSQATVYVRDPKLGPAVRKLLRRHAPGLYRIVERAELDRLGALPGAFCALEPMLHRGPGLPGYGFSADAAPGPLVVPTPHVKGNHGPLPSSPELHTGFVAWGAGIAPRDLGQIRILDVAPTLARVLDLSLPGTLPGKRLDLR